VSDVFNEVDEELRKEQASRLARRFLPLMIVAVVLIVGGVAGFQGWDWWQTKQKAQAADSYWQAKKLLDGGNLPNAQLSFEAIAANGPAGYAALAKMQAAIAATKLGQTAQAAKLYTDAANSFDDPLFADLAHLKAAIVVADEMSFADIEARLTPLAGAGRPFRAMAREMIAAKAMSTGDLRRARTEYTLLSFALDAPAGVQQRANMALSLLGPEPVVRQPETVDDASPDETPADETPER